MAKKKADNYGLNTPLVVVRRAKGGMMERWEQRWSDNVARYCALECVKLILPWSTPAMRLCTSELKTAPICQHLVKRFVDSKIVNVTGIRRAESDGRADAPIAKPEPKLTSSKQITVNGKKKWAPSTSGVTWNPNVLWSTEEVFDYLNAVRFPLHEAYTRWHMTRVSCALCIMQNEADQLNSLENPEHHPLFRRMVRLESVSTFAFQGNSWLADRAPQLLDSITLAAIECAKHNGKRRERAESWVPKHLLYTKGWPTCIPSEFEAEQLCLVRSQVAKAVGLRDVEYTEPAELIERYRELYVAKHGAI